MRPTTNNQQRRTRKPSKPNEPKNNSGASKTQGIVIPDSADEIVSPKFAENIETFLTIFKNCSDLVHREIECYIDIKRKGGIFFIDGLSNAELINDTILKPLMIEMRSKLYEHNNYKDMSDLMKMLMVSSEAKLSSKNDELVRSVLDGDTVLFIEGMDEALIINSKGWEKRGITEPQTETVVRGPREGFTESLRSNTALIRRRIKTPQLKTEMLRVGEKTSTNICLLYIEGVINPSLVDEIKNRIKTINTDAILNDGYLEQYISDNPSSLFQTIAYSEKPDIVVGKMLEGRAALIIDGSPFVLTMPQLFIEHFNISEDYESSAYYATFLRILRLIAFVISISGPSIYIALTCFHHELIPTPLLFTMAASSEGLPFPAAMETMLMLITFEILKEAGLRLPKPVGQAISIVGALVMGQAAVQAGLVGAPVVIIIAMTGVASFVSAFLMEATALLRWFLLILTVTMGGVGFIIGTVLIMVHLASIKSFGTPYLSPLAPFHFADLKDSIIKMPIWTLKTRPSSLNPVDMTRQRMSKPNFHMDRDKNDAK
jgi:spore germination protein KA